MKKIIFILMLVCGLSVFAEKLTTDGKYHEREILGIWPSAFLEFTIRNNVLYAINDDPAPYSPEDIVLDIVKVRKHKNGVISVNFFKNDVSMIKYFAWDTKYKTLVEVNSKLDIIDKHTRVRCTNCN